MVSRVEDNKHVPIIKCFSLRIVDVRTDEALFYSSLDLFEITSYLELFSFYDPKTDFLTLEILRHEKYILVCSRTTRHGILNHQY